MNAWTAVNPIDDASLLSRAILKLGLRSVELGADDISQALGLFPTVSWSRGDAKYSPDGRKYPAAATVWSVNTNHLASDASLETHVDYLLSAFEPIASKLAAIRPRLENSGIWITLLPTDWSATVAVSGPKLARLSNLVDEVVISQGSK